MKNKKIYIIIGIIAIALVVFLIVKNSNKGKSSTSKPKEKVEFYQAFDIDNIENANISIIKSNKEKIAEKYVTKNDLYVTKENVKLNDRDGKVIYLRNSYNKLNIYQTKYRIDELDYYQQIEKYIDEFSNSCTGQVGVLDEPLTKTIYGSTESNFDVSESIYKEKKIYTLTYRVEDETMAEENTAENSFKQYEINFYRNGEYLMCEFVNIL